MFRVYGSIFVPDDIVVTPFNVAFYTHARTTNDMGFNCVFGSRYDIENKRFEIEGTSNRPDVIVIVVVQKNFHNQTTRVCVKCREIRHDCPQKFPDSAVVLDYHAINPQFIFNREINFWN
jgi:hypothetical protein